MVVGMTFKTIGDERIFFPYRWDREGVEPEALDLILAPLEAGGSISVIAISADGSAIIGNFERKAECTDPESGSTESHTYYRGFQLRNDTPQDLGALGEPCDVPTGYAGTTGSSGARGVSADGSVIIGNIRNKGGAKTYDLKVLEASTNGERISGHQQISPPANSSHEVRPRWNALADNPVTILVDLGNDGTVDDTLAGRENIGDSFSAPSILNIYKGAKKMSFGIRMALTALLLVTSVVRSQVIIPDFRVNSAADNLKGLWRTAVAAMPDGRFAVAWQDFNDYNVPVTEQPRVAVQTFGANGTTFGALNLFRGESRSLAIWTSDFLEGNPDITYMPDGTLLVAVEHEGRLSIGPDDVGSSEVGFGAISSAGEIIDVSNNNGVILWNATTRVDWQEHPRIAVDPSGNIYLVANGPTFDTRRHSIEMQVFDSDGNYAGDPIIPHTGDPGPDFNHYFADVATNGEVLAVCWQDGRQDVNFDITAQFYDINGPTGQNRKVNAGDPAGTVNIWPSIAMNASGASVIVWADARNSSAGDIYGQRFNAAGSPAGGNFRISEGRGEIMDRPEVAMLDNGSFMVVWTDSSAVFGDNAYRAMGRQFNANAQPVNDPFVIPGLDVASGLVNIASDGSAYYCAWLDSRDLAAYWNVYAKKFGPAVTSVQSQVASEARPRDFKLDDAYPNPFNPETTIGFSIARTSIVEIEVYNTAGKRVAVLADASYEPGLHEVTFSAGDLPSGVYIYRIQAETFRASKKVLLLK